eukprot:10889152-Karenia_brevis.AAC.1
MRATTENQEKLFDVMSKMVNGSTAKAMSEAMVGLEAAVEAGASSAAVKAGASSAASGEKFTSETQKGAEEFGERKVQDRDEQTT